LIHYNVTGSYCARNEMGIIWDDPEIGIEWPKTKDLIISEKDLQNKPLSYWKDQLPLCKQLQMFNEFC